MSMISKADLMEKGRLRQGAYKHGQYGDIILMSVLSSEWAARKLED